MYRDAIPYKELVDASGPFGANGLLISRIHRLLQRSGAHNVTSSVLTRRNDLCRMTHDIAVSFDSRAWTGLA